MRIQKPWVITVGVTALLLVWASRQGAGNAPAWTGGAAQDSLLALIDQRSAGAVVGRPSDYAVLLDSLTERCDQSRTHIGDMAVKAQQLIREEFGRDVTIRSVLIGLSAATANQTGVDCAGVLAPLMVLLGKGV